MKPNAGHKIMALGGGADVRWHLWELEMCLSRYNTCIVGSFIVVM